MPMMTLILAAQSRCSNSLTAKKKKRKKQYIQVAGNTYAYQLGGYAQVKSLTVKML
jgi:hypothetical protein